MPSAIVVTPFRPSAIGHGGDHRTYQIVKDLELIVGEGGVAVIEVGRGQELVYAGRHLRPRLSFTRRVARRVALVLENPLTLVARNTFSAKCFSHPEWLSAYKEIVSAAETPRVCVVEHAGLVDLVQVNQALGIPTVACVQNLETLDTANFFSPGRRTALAAGVDFANELRALSRCREQLYISRVEAALMRGLGAPSHYYPYRPVGEIRGALESIREAREARGAAEGVFLVLGTATHRTTEESMRWLLDGVRRNGLPPGAQVVVCGLGTEELTASVSHPSIQVRGWVEQGELVQLLTTCRAVLVPQRSGFGALTRLPEFACAGVPMIVSKHPLAALDTPPGIEVAADTYESWYAKMAAARATTPLVSVADYSAWETRQSRTLEVVTRSLLEESF